MEIQGKKQNQSVFKIQDSFEKNLSIQTVMEENLLIVIEKIRIPCVPYH